MSYDAVVNKKDLNVGRLAAALNDREQRGWQLVHIFEQDGNTVQIFQSNTLLDQLLAEQRRTNQLLEWIGQKLGSTSTS